MNHYFWVTGWAKKAKKKTNNLIEKAYSATRLALAQQRLINALTVIINMEKGNR